MSPLVRTGILSGVLIALGWLRPDPVVYAHHCGDFLDCFATLRTAVSATLGLSMFAVLISVGLDFTPGVGQVKGIIEAITGKDLVTGEELESYERLLGIVGPAGRVFSLGASLSRGIGAVDDISDLSRVSSRVPSRTSWDGARPNQTARLDPDGRTVYGVDPSLQAADEAAGVLRRDAYIRNPTARRLADLLTETGRIGGKRMSGRFMYVVDRNGDIIIGTRAGQRMPHPTLIGGQNPEVRAAGIVDIRGGRIYSVDNASGHFKPGPDSLQAAEEAFSRLPGNAFRRDFQGYIPFEG